MLISLCTAVMNRLDDLRQVMPSRIAAMNESAPVELLILDWGSTDGLPEYMDELMEIARLPSASFITYKRVEREYWHMARAYNLAMLSSHGDYVVNLSADGYTLPGYIPTVRGLIADGCIWGRADRLRGIVFIARDEFVASGGYDERFELYGPEDRDFDQRMIFRDVKFGLVPPGLLSSIPTPDGKKVANYRIKGNKSQMSRKMRYIYDENTSLGVTAANRGKIWGIG